MNFSGKKLLILAGAGVHNKVVKAAKEMGIYTIVSDYLPDSPAKKLADESWMYSITDIDEIVRLCKEKNVDGVLNFCIDPAQKPYQKICQQLNLPCYATGEQFEIMTNKRNFKDFCIKHGVDVIPEYDENDILNDRVDYPVFVKPNISRGSRGQSICYNKEECIKAIATARENSNDNDFICEKYMCGKQDIGSAFFVIDGQPYLVKLGDRFLGSPEDNLQKQVICTRLPSAFYPQFEKNVIPKVVEMIKSLGIKYGPVFLQGFIDGDTVRYYDPALRMPGGDYDLILKKATGFDTVKSLISFALTGDTKICIGNIKDAYKLNNGTALLITISVKAGVIDKIVGFDEIMAHPNIVYGRQIIGVGEKIEGKGDISQRVAAFGLFIPFGQPQSECIEMIYNTYKVLNTQGENMIVSKFDSNMLF